MADNPYNMVGGDPPDLGEGAGMPVAEAAPAAQSPASRTYKSQMNRANIIMAALFIGAGGLVYVLTLRKGPAQASADVRNIRTEVNSALQQFKDSGRFSVDAQGARIDTKKLLEKFKDQVSRRQIPMSALRKDPFVFVPPPRAAVRAGGPAEVVQAPPPDPKAQSRREVQGRFDSLRLQGIQRGRGGMVAIISNNLVTIGQRIDCFTVRKIEEESVTLAWEDEEFVLKMR